MSNNFNQNYKMWHPPNMSPTARTKQGYYKLQNPQKYLGNPNLVIFRSSWEYSFCRWCDFSPSIIKWTSEPMQIPYYDRVSKLEECKRQGLDPNNPKNWEIKRYNTDFWIEVDKGDGVTDKMFIEIKPLNQLKKPMPPDINASLKEQRRFNNIAKEFLINEAKWAAMNAWAKKNNMKFYILTEKTLSSLLGRFWAGNLE